MALSGASGAGDAGGELNLVIDLMMQLVRSTDGAAAPRAIAATKATTRTSQPDISKPKYRLPTLEDQQEARAHVPPAGQATVAPAPAPISVVAALAPVAVPVVVPPPVAAVKKEKKPKRARPVVLYDEEIASVLQTWAPQTANKTLPKLDDVLPQELLGALMSICVSIEIAGAWRGVMMKLQLLGDTGPFLRNLGFYLKGKTVCALEQIRPTFVGVYKELKLSARAAYGYRALYHGFNEFPGLIHFSGAISFWNKYMKTIQRVLRKDVDLGSAFKNHYLPVVLSTPTGDVEVIGAPPAAKPPRAPAYSLLHLATDDRAAPMTVKKEEEAVGEKEDATGLGPG